MRARVCAMFAFQTLSLYVRPNLAPLFARIWFLRRSEEAIQYPVMEIDRGRFQLYALRRHH